MGTPFLKREVGFFIVQLTYNLSSVKGRENGYMVKLLYTAGKTDLNLLYQEKPVYSTQQKKEQLYMKILLGFVATMVLTLMLFIGSVLASTTIENFDIKGIKLGMSVEEIKSAFPQISIEKFNPEEMGMAEILTKYFLRSGRLQVSIAKEQYGSGTFCVSYTEFVKRVDPSTLLTGVKNDLVAKYGKPQYENLDRGQNYFACWGDDCNQNLNKQILRKVDNQYLYVYRGIIKPGKYLIVHFIIDDNTPHIELTLFDTAPYVNYLQGGEKKKIPDSNVILKKF